MKRYVVVIDVWSQCSSDYQAVKETAVIDLEPETTIAEVMELVSKWNVLGRGDVRIVEASQLSQ